MFGPATRQGTEKIEELEEKERKRKEREEKKKQKENEKKKEEEKKRKAEEKARKAAEKQQNSARERSKPSEKRAQAEPQPKAQKTPRVVSAKDLDGSINANECCVCLVSYDEDVEAGTGSEWIMCACGRWAHEDCIDDVVLDVNGQERLCPVCIM